MPGGFGKLDEFFEALTLIQTKKILQFPIIIFDTKYHAKLLEHIEYMKEKKTISSEDIDLILLTDSIEEAVEFIKKKALAGLVLSLARSLNHYDGCLKRIGSANRFSHNLILSSKV